MGEHRTVGREGGKVTLGIVLVAMRKVSPRLDEHRNDPILRSGQAVGHFHCMLLPMLLQGAGDPFDDGCHACGTMITRRKSVWVESETKAPPPRRPNVIKNRASSLK